MNAVRTGLAIVGGLTVIRAVLRFAARSYITRVRAEQLREELDAMKEACDTILREQHRNVREAKGDGG